VPKFSIFDLSDFHAFTPQSLYMFGPNLASLLFSVTIKYLYGIPGGIEIRSFKISGWNTPILSWGKILHVSGSRRLKPKGHVIMLNFFFSRLKGLRHEMF
jgi:hypothetical protein